MPHPTTTDRLGKQHAAYAALAEMVAELVRSDQLMDEQADEARGLLATVGVEV